MRPCNLLIVHDSKPCGPLLQHVQETGVQLHVAVPHGVEWVREYVEASRTIYTDPFSTTPLLSDVLAYEMAAGVRFDAVGAFCEFCVGTAADLAQALGLPGVAPGAARRTSLNKLLMRRVCQEHGLPTPAWRTVRGLSAAGLRQAAGEVGFPCVVKPVFGRDSLGAFQLRTPQDCDLAEAAVRATWNPERASGAYAVFTELFMVEEYIPGPLVSVDGLVDGPVTDIAGVIEVGMCPEPWFSQQVNWFPARLPPADNEAAADAARMAVAALGLDRCVFHAEVKCSDAGPVLIEIAPRPAGGHIPAAYRRACDIDLHHLQLALWLGEHPRIAPVAPRGHLVQRGVFPSGAGRVLRVDGFDRAEAAPGVWQFVGIAQSGDQIQTHPEAPVPIYYYAVEGSTPEEAAARAREVEERIVVITETDVAS
jgi:biotin carboxylase